MIELDGCRSRGFSNTVNGDSAELREQLLQNLQTGTTIITTQQTQNNQYKNDLVSESPSIIHYYVGWPTYIMETVRVSNAYAVWWATHGRAMQEKLNQYLDQLNQLDNILTQKGK